MVKRDTVKKTGAWIYMILILMILYLPLLWIFAFSFTTSSTVGTFKGFTFDVYGNLFSGKYTEEIMAALGNTLLIALLAVLFSTILGTLGAIGIHNMKKRSRQLLYTMNRIPLLDAEVVTALSLLALFIFIGLPKGMIAVVIAHTAFCTPYVMLNVLPKLKQMNPNTYEAALDLGASPKQALFKVILPQIKGGMIAGAIMAFTISIDDFVITQYLKKSGGFHFGRNFETLSTYIYSFTKKPLPPEIRALSSLMFLFVLGLLLIINFGGKKKKQSRA